MPKSIILKENMHRFIIILVSFFNLFLFGQNKSMPCNKILENTLYSFQETNNLNDSFKKDLEILAICGKFDTLDIKIFNHQLLGVLSVNLLNEKKKINYRNIIKSYNDFRNSFGQNKLFESFKYDLEEPKKLETKTNEYIFKRLRNFEEVIDDSNGNGKKILLFFSGFACANSKRLFDKIANDLKVKDYLTLNYNSYIMYLDDRMIDEETGITFGKKWIELQSELTQKNHQPYFCIINSNKEVLSDFGYTDEIGDFLKFLKME